MFLGQWKKRYRVTERELALLLNISRKHVSRTIKVGAGAKLALDIERVSRGKVTILEALYPDEPEFVQDALERRRKEWIAKLEEYRLDHAA